MLTRGDQTNVCMAGIGPSLIMASLPPSQSYHTALLCPESHLFRIFFFLFFIFSKMHIQWAWKLATAYVFLEWTSSCRSGLVVTIVPYKYRFLAEFQSMAYCLLAFLFFFWDIKKASLEHNFKPDDSLWVLCILWEQSQRTDLGLWANLTWRLSSLLSDSLQIPVQMNFFHCRQHGHSWQGGTMPPFSLAGSEISQVKGGAEGI